MPLPEERQVIARALDQLEDLTEWENDFIQNLAGLDKYEPLTPKQKESLGKIEAKLDD